MRYFAWNMKSVFHPEEFQAKKQRELQKLQNAETEHFNQLQIILDPFSFMLDHYGLFSNIFGQMGKRASFSLFLSFCIDFEQLSKLYDKLYAIRKNILCRCVCCVSKVSQVFQIITKFDENYSQIKKIFFLSYSLCILFLISFSFSENASKDLYWFCRHRKKVVLLLQSNNVFHQISAIYFNFPNPHI